MSRFLLLFVTFVCLPFSVFADDFDHAKAYTSHRDFMVEGIWLMGTGEETNVHDHVASRSGSFTRIEPLSTDETFSGIYGIDPKTNKFTVWFFNEDGSTSTWVCSDYQEGKYWEWTLNDGEERLTGTITCSDGLEATSSGPEGKQTVTLRRK